VNVGAVLSHVTEGFVALGVPGGLAWYVRDRRKSRAESAVAERTVDATVDVQDTGAADARLAYVQRQMDLERNFHRQQLTDRDAEIVFQRVELSRRAEVIRDYRQEADTLQQRLCALTDQLSGVRDRLNELTHRDAERAADMGRNSS
jgi:hypothetical protein